jgi:hypothetical protein
MSRIFECLISILPFLNAIALLGFSTPGAFDGIKLFGSVTVFQRL